MTSLISTLFIPFFTSSLTRAALPRGLLSLSVLSASQLPSASFASSSSSSSSSSTTATYGSCAASSSGLDGGGGGGGGVACMHGVSLLGQEAAAALDVDLMQEPVGFKLEQLMELAGLSVAAAFADAFPLPSSTSSTSPLRVVVICGPGNNGGDGLVAARHLHHFGYGVVVVVPKAGLNPYFRNLEQQCRDLGLPVVASLDEAVAHNSNGNSNSNSDNDKDSDSGSDDSRSLSGAFDVVVDAMFGFSFKGSPRPPFDDIIATVNREQQSAAQGAGKQGCVKVLSVDIPSGWDVEAGPNLSSSSSSSSSSPAAAAPLQPDVLVSLTAPKLCAQSFGQRPGQRHYLGGRFVPNHIRDKYQLQLPPFPGAAQCVELEGWSSSASSASSAAASSS